MTTLAIDIGGTKLAAARVDEDLQIRERIERPTPASKTPDALREALAELIAPLQAQAQRVAVASTGIIRDGSLLAINPQNLGGLLHFPLVETVKAITGLPTLAVNDAQAAAWAEYHALADATRDMVFITVSTGVGGGVVSGGKLLTGSGGWPGISDTPRRIRTAHGAAAVGLAAWRRLPRDAALPPPRKAILLVATPEPFLHARRKGMRRRHSWLRARRKYWRG